MKHLAGLFALCLGLLAASPATAAPPAKAAQAAAQCINCHETEAKTHVYHGDCVSCHSNSSAHASNEEAREAGGAAAAKLKNVLAGKAESKQCLNCHEKDNQRMHFAFAEHNKAGVQCSDCHGTHSPKVKTLNAAQVKGGKTTALCATCHQDILAKFNLPSHHPVKEGGVTCTGCHDPHASKQTRLTGKTELCTSCHQAVRGPHVFEHAPVVEDCTTCHDPHGAPNRKLLSVAQPMQCLQCHSIAGNRHGQTAATNNTQIISGAVLRDCASCHGAVHGSSIDQHLRH